MARPNRENKRKTAGSQSVAKKRKKRPTPERRTLSPRAHWAPLLVIAALATLPYWQSLSYEYVLDDKMVFTENQFVQQGLAGMGDIFGKESFAGYFGEQMDLLVGARYRPLSLATFALEYELWGQNARLSHLVNILLYGLAGLLLYVTLWFLLPVAKDRSWFLTVPFAAALLFVLHPIHSEVVANVKGRDEILTLLGALGALYLSLRYAQTPHWKWLAGSSFVFFLALLAKENALTFLAAVPLGLYLFANAGPKKLAWVTLSLLGTALAYLFIRYSVVGYLLTPAGQEVTNLMNNPFYGLDAGERFATVFYTLGQYVKLLIFPHPLTHDYYPYQAPIMSWSDWRTLLSLLVQIGLLALAAWAWRRRKVLAYGILFYFITLSIVSNVFFTVGTFMNERFVFMPSVGFALVLGWLIVDRLPTLLKTRRQIVALALLASISVAYLARTWIRVPDWRNAYALNLAAAKYSPNSARANLFLGVAIYEGEFQAETDRQKKQELLNEIAYFVDRSVQILPSYRSAQNFRAGIAAQQYLINRQLGPLLAVFSEVAVYNPDASNLHSYLEWLAAKGDPTGELAAFAHRTGFEILAQQQRNYAAAIRILEYGLRGSPNNPQILQDLGLVYRAMGNEAKAREYLGG